MDPLPQSWEIRECKDYPGRCYFYNTITRESTWIRPNLEKPKTIYVSQILLKTNKSADPNTKNGPVKRTVEEGMKELNDLRESILENLDGFAQMANEISEADGQNDGVLGWIRQNDVPPEFAQAAWNLKLNELSEIVQTKLGLHLIFRQQ